MWPGRPARERIKHFERAYADYGLKPNPAYIHPGERTGYYRTATDQLIVNDKGQSEISAEDYAIAIADEVEKPKHIRERFTAAW